MAHESDATSTRHAGHCVGVCVWGRATLISGHPQPSPLPLTSLHRVCSKFANDTSTRLRLNTHATSRSSTRCCCCCMNVKWAHHAPPRPSLCTPFMSAPLSAVGVSAFKSNSFISVRGKRQTEVKTSVTRLLHTPLAPSCLSPLCLFTCVSGVWRTSRSTLANDKSVNSATL